MDRITKLCTYLQPCNTFADVACDHGYCAEYMLKNNLCERAVVSDISEKSLSKAQTLLSVFVENGRCRAVCCDGLDGIDEKVDEVLIAGIGGEEIVRILKNSYIPGSFVFQPMKNAEALRGYLLKMGCAFTADDIFTDGRNYYFIITGSRTGEKQNYSKAQRLYGRDSLLNSVFCEYLKNEIAKKKNYLTREMSEESRLSLEADVAFMEGVLNGEAH